MKEFEKGTNPTLYCSGKTRANVMPNMLRDPKSFRQTTLDTNTQRKMSELCGRAVRSLEEADRRKKKADATKEPVDRQPLESEDTL